MEGIVLLGLAGVGYLINKNKEENNHIIDTSSRPPMYQNSNTSIYDLNNYKDSKLYETELVSKSFNQRILN